MKLFASRPSCVAKYFHTDRTYRIRTVNVIMCGMGLRQYTMPSKCSVALADRDLLPLKFADSTRPLSLTMLCVCLRAHG